MYRKSHSLLIFQFAIVALWLLCLSVRSKRLPVGLLEGILEQSHADASNAVVLVPAQREPLRANLLGLKSIVLNAEPSESG